MPIAYDAVNNIITVTGYTAAVPCTFEDVYQADLLGGWGVVTKQSVAQYLLECRLYIGDAVTETHFADTLKQVLFGANCIGANGGRIIWAKANAYLTLGNLIDATAKSTSDGVSLAIADTGFQFHSFVYIDSNARAYLYSCQILNLNEGVRIYCGFRCNAADYSRLWNSQLNNLETNWLSYIDVYNLVTTDAKVLSPTSTALAIRGDTTIDDAKVFDVATIFGCAPNAPLQASNVYARKSDYLMRAFSTVNSEDNRPVLTDVDIDNWAFSWVVNALAFTTYVYRKYTFNLKVTDKSGTAISGATVTLKDKNDTEVFSETTAADGTITEQTVTRGYYEQAQGDTLQDLSPHTLTIKAAGYQTYTLKGITIEKTNWVVRLTRTVPILLDVRHKTLLANVDETEPENMIVIGVRKY